MHYTKQKLMRTILLYAIITLLCVLHLGVDVTTYNYMLNKNTLGVKKARPIRSSIANRYVRPKPLISVEAKKLLIKNLLST